MSGAIRDTLEWGIPVLITRSPDGVIFEVQRDEETSRQADKGTRRETAQNAATNRRRPALIYRRCLRLGYRRLSSIRLKRPL